jgi:Mitochondrial inner membrane protein
MQQKQTEQGLVYKQIYCIVGHLGNRLGTLCIFDFLCLGGGIETGFDELPSPPMIRAALSKARGSSSPSRLRAGSTAMPPQLSAGVPRTLLTVVTVPVVAVALGMHYSSDVRSRVDRVIPGASESLSKVTHADYGSDQTNESSVAPPKGRSRGENSAESLQDLISRVTDQEAEAPVKLSDSATDKKGTDSAKGGFEISKDPGHSAEAAMPEKAKLATEKDISGADSNAITHNLQRDSRTSASDKPSTSTEDSAKADGASSNRWNGNLRSSVEANTHANWTKDDREPSKIEAKAQGEMSQSKSSGARSDSFATTRSLEANRLSATDDASSNTNSTSKLARVFGRGEIDFEGGPVEDVDISVYKRPTAEPSLARLSKSMSSPAHTVKDSLLSPSEQEIAALKAELESLAKWDAVRLQEAVRAQSVAEKKVASSEAARMAKQHKAELDACQEKAALDAKRMIETKSAQLEAEMIRRRDEEIVKLIEVREKDLREELELRFLDREREKVEERQREMISLKASVAALHEDLDQSREYRKAAQHTSLVSATTFSLCDIVHERIPLTRYLEAVSQSHDLGKLVAASIPEEQARKGVPTVDDLKSSFQSVSREGLKAALVPKDSVGSIWGHMLATVVSHLKVAVDVGSYLGSSKEPKTDEERVRLAEDLVTKGKLSEAVEVLESLGPLPAEIAHDWLALAKARIAADLGARALLADAIVTQCSLSSPTAHAVP